MNYKDTECAENLCIAMSDVYEIEAQRAQFVREILGSYFENGDMNVFSFGSVHNLQNDGGYVSQVEPKVARLNYTGKQDYSSSSDEDSGDEANSAHQGEGEDKEKDKLSASVLGKRKIEQQTCVTAKEATVVVGRTKEGIRNCAFLYTNLAVNEKMEVEKGLCFFMHSLLECEEVFRRSRCPSLIITVDDNFLSLHTAAFADELVMDPATPFLPLLILPHDRVMMEGLARALRAAKDCVHRLRRYYEEELPKINLSSEEQLQLHYPALNYFYLHFGADTRIRVDFSYVPAPSTQKLVYQVCIKAVGEVEAVPADSFRGHVLPQGTACPLKVGDTVVVKFTRTYCHEAHALCAKKDAAPTLYAVNGIAGGWKLVVMEVMVDPEEVALCGNMKRMKGKLAKAVNALHAADWVHGHLWSRNVWFVETENSKGKIKERLRIVDFDFSGKEDVALYPSFLNRGLEWP